MGLVTFFFTTLLASSVQAESNEDLILPPSAGAIGAERLFILIPGANVATSYYDTTAKAIQDATSQEARLWVVVPSMPTKKCILLCTTDFLCAPLHERVQDAVKKAVRQGYAGNVTGDDVFMAGHSLGGTCASTLVSSYAKSKGNGYGSLVVMGSYVTDQNVEDFPVPVLTLGAALDGGLGRPGMLVKSMRSSLRPTKSTVASWYVRHKPVVILEDLDHSSFCPGFRVPGDIWPAEVDDAAGAERVGEIVGAFLILLMNAADPADEYEKILIDATHRTQFDLLKPYTDALALEIDDNVRSSPWCAASQRVLAGLRHSEDEARLSLINATYFDDAHQFEHSRVHYRNISGGSVHLDVSGHNDYYKGGVTDLGESCLVPAHDIGCKLASADRIAQQLGIGADDYAHNVTCREVSKAAIEKAWDLLNSTDGGRHVLELYEKRGRPICLLPDTTVLFNIGPLFISETISLKDNGTCLAVKSLTLGPQPLDSRIFPGVHYCKVLSPARVIDYMMTDALKPMSGCLNK